MVDSSAGSAAPVAMTSGLMPGWPLRTCRAPSIRGWMFDWPGVAMNSATSPDGTSSAMRLPISCPDTKRSCPM